MKVLQVKKYHSKVASKKYQKALENWKKGITVSCPVESMFYFFRTDYRGCPHTPRKNGYVAYDDNSAYYGRNEHTAVVRFQKNKELDKRVLHSAVI